MRIRLPAPAGRAVLALGAVGLLSPLFALTTSSNNNFVLVQGFGLVVLPLLGLVAVLGALAGQRAMVLLAAGGFVLAAAVQLAQFGRSTNWLGGNGSTFSLLMALGIGLLAVALVPSPPPFDPYTHRPRQEPPRDGSEESP